MIYLENYKGYYLYENGKVWSIACCKFLKPLPNRKKRKYRLHRTLHDYDEIYVDLLLKQYYSVSLASVEPIAQPFKLSFP